MEQSATLDRRERGVAHRLLLRNFYGTVKEHEAKTFTRKLGQLSNTLTDGTVGHLEIMKNLSVAIP